MKAATVPIFSVATNHCVAASFDHGMRRLLITLLLFAGPASQARGMQQPNSDQPNHARPSPIRKEVLAVPEPETGDLGTGTRVARPVGTERRGACRLHLTAFDAFSGKPVATTVDLWRLDLPADAEWKQGDQRLGAFEVGVEGSVIDRLEVGRYRVVIGTADPRQPDPPPIRISGRTNRATLLVVPPRPVTAHLELYDRLGRPVTRAWRGRTFTRKFRNERLIPRWAAPRQRHDPISRMWGCPSRKTTFQLGPKSKAWDEVAAGAEGFEIGPLPGDGRLLRRTYTVGFRDRHGVEVHCEIPGRPRRPQRYVGVFAAAEPFVAAARFPDGRPAATSDSWVRVVGRALRRDRCSGASCWAEAPVDAVVWMPPFRAVFHHKLSQGSPKMSSLEPTLVESRCGNE